MDMIKLLKSWKHPYRNKPYCVGTVLQIDNIVGSELIASKIAERYTGEYPPKQKHKNELKTLNNK